MANRLIPYSQDEEKWTSHYMAQAMRQIKPKEMTKPLKEKDGAAIYCVTHNAIGSPS